MDSPDAIDGLLAAWRTARPDLDPAPLGLVGRVIVLAKHLERSVDAALEKHGLSLGQFDILATLRRSGLKGGLTPTQLLESVVLSSGGMTARLDQLAKDDLIARRADTTDRRKVVVELTAKGRKLIDVATATRFEEAKRSLPPMKPSELKELEELLRNWLNARS
jgi:DNA-binding MarR family transcriptional regulator